MIILIDGYNLLKQIFPKEVKCLEQQRLQLIRQLSLYKKNKGTDVTDIILVFDAGPFSRASREIRGGVVIMFSGQKSTADEWIEEYVQAHTTLEIHLITMDRKLREACKRPNVHPFGVLEFYTLVQNNIYEQSAPEAVIESGLKKFKNDDKWIPELDEEGYSAENVDVLMAQTTFKTPKKNEIDNRTDNKKGNAQKLSKEQRSMLKKIDKLK